MSIPDIISAIGSPLCGFLVDNYGHRSTLLPIASILIFTCHALLTFSSNIMNSNTNHYNWIPVIAMSILGIAYSMFASALWPCVSYLVGRHQIATAYGLITVALNVSLSLFPLIVGEIRKRGGEDDFLGMGLFFMVMSC